MYPIEFSLWLRRLALALMFTLGCVHAPAAQAQARVTAADVANAIRNSPNASPWLRANADAVGNLAMFESSGRLDVYNGSCCSGVLQMNRDNIRIYAGVSPEVFRTWGLQQQVDAWSRYASLALRDRAPTALAAMTTFDGRPVDAHLVLACTQYGQPNCQRMLNSGRCNGWADPTNGTTICDMADGIARGGTGNPAPNPGGGDNPGDGTPWHPPSCVRGVDGGCMSMNEAIRAGFEAGSGVSMERLRSFNQMLLVLITLLVVGSAMVGVWQNYAKGAITKADLVLYMQRGLIIVGMVFVIMSLF